MNKNKNKNKIIPLQQRKIRRTLTKDRTVIII